MDTSSANPWSGSPNAPQVSHPVYFSEKVNFAGFLLSAIFYGIVIVLFLQCMKALSSSVKHTNGCIRRGLVANITAMFLSVTIYTAMALDIQSISYIDHREFTGVNDVLPSGPFGYQFSIYPSAINVIADATFLFNTWLADGLLLYRCYVIYERSYWAIAFPCLMYLASSVMGIMIIHDQASQPGSIPKFVGVAFGVPYYSIFLSLNALLTLMIVIRLALHNRRVRNAREAPTSACGLYKAVITMVIESCALYAVSFLLYIGPWCAGSYFPNIFLPVLAETQAIASFLIILRVANRRASTSDVIAFEENDDSAGHLGSTSSGGTLPDWNSAGSMGAHGRGTDGLCVWVETTVGEAAL